jgi:hypothetical protein
MNGGPDYDIEGATSAWTSFCRDDLGERIKVQRRGSLVDVLPTVLSILPAY